MMIAVVVVAVIVGLWLLSKTLQVQAVRALVDVERLAVEQQRLALDQERATRDELRTVEYQKAKTAGQLTEFFEKHAEELLGDDITSGPVATPEVANDLEQEALRRGIRCVAKEYFDEPKYPGLEPQPYVCCADECKTSRHFGGSVPPEFQVCPFCSGPLRIEEFSTEELARWRIEMTEWTRFRKLFPVRAAEVEARSDAVDRAFDAKELAESRARIEQLVKEKGASGA